MRDDGVAALRAAGCIAAEEEAAQLAAAAQRMGPAFRSCSPAGSRGSRWHG